MPNLRLEEKEPTTSERFGCLSGCLVEDGNIVMEVGTHISKAQAICIKGSGHHFCLNGIHHQNISGWFLSPDFQVIPEQRLSARFHYIYPWEQCKGWPDVFFGNKTINPTASILSS